MNAELLFGKIAVAAGYLTEMQVQALLDAQSQGRAAGQAATLGELAQEQGLMTSQQVQRALLVQEFSELRDAGKRLGAIAVKNGLATEEQIARALEEQQQEYKHTHKAPRKLGEILVARGFLGQQQLDALLSAQTRIVAQAASRAAPLLARASPPAANDVTASLRIESGTGVGRSFPIGKKALLGRLSTCEVALLEPRASRQHARVQFDAATRQHVVTDLNTPNGTLVNGERIRGNVILKPGDRIQIGETTIRYEAGAWTKFTALDAAQTMMEPLEAGAVEAQLDTVILTPQARQRTQPPTKLVSAPPVPTPPRDTVPGHIVEEDFLGVGDLPAPDRAGGSPRRPPPPPTTRDRDMGSRGPSRPGAAGDVPTGSAISQAGRSKAYSVGSEDDVLLAQVAIDAGLVTQQQVDTCLSEMRRSQRRLPLSVVLLEKGFVDREGMELIYVAYFEAKRGAMAPHDAAAVPGESGSVGVEGIEYVVTVLRGEDEGRSFTLLTGYPSIVGRGARATVRLSDSFVSREHCLIETRDLHVICRPLSERAPTLVNDRVVQGRAEIGPADRVTIGRTTFSVVRADSEVDREEVLPALAPGVDKGFRVEARDLTKVVVSRDTGKELALLDGINLVLHPGEFAVILGPSGSGKSTLMDALNGRRRATSGHVLYDELDFYSEFDAFRTRMGYLPQKDIVHGQLTVRAAVFYTAKLRLPASEPGGRVSEIIDTVVGQMALEGREHTRIANLSGGQVKRVSLGAELIPNPSILFLDEATSGLDAGTERKMMTLFRQVADRGKTVVCITHNIENIGQADLVMVVFKGKLVYYGPPERLTDHFGIASVADLYDRLEDQEPVAWEQAYQQTDLYLNFVKNRQQSGPGKAPRRLGHDAVGGTRGRRLTTGLPSVSQVMRTGASSLHQFLYLTLRYLTTTLRDTRNLAILVLQAPLIALVISAVFTDNNLLLFMLAVSALWFGCINSSKEIVKELDIYKRERMVNLQILPYVLSKLVVLVALSAIQCWTLLTVVRAETDLSGPFLLEFATLLNASIGGLVMGLLVSALVNTTDKALALVPLVLIPQIVYTVYPAIGHQMGAANEVAAQIFIMAYWAFDALKMAEVKDVVADYGVNLVGDIVFANAVLLVMEGVVFAATLAALRRKDRELVQ